MAWAVLKLALQKMPKTTLQTRRLQQTKQGKQLTDVLLLTNILYSSKFWGPYDFFFLRNQYFDVQDIYNVKKDFYLK